MPSLKKHRVAQGLKIGKNFHQLAEELKIAQATAEVYGIDCLAARCGPPDNRQVSGRR